MCAAAIATTAGCLEDATPPPVWDTSPERVTSDNSALQIAVTADETSISGNHLEKLESGMWKVTGNYPFVVFPLQSAVDGSVNAKLGFLFLCDDAAGKHVVQIFWQPKDGHIS